MIGAYIEEIVSAVIAAFVGAITWLVRVVLTNQEEIKLLKAEIANRDERRKEDRELLLEMREDIRSEMKDVKEDVEGLRSELLEIWKKK